WLPALVAFVLTAVSLAQATASDSAHAAVPAPAESSTSADRSPAVVQLLGNPEEFLHEGAELEVSFPQAMIAASQIDTVAARSPLVFEPETKGKFLWKSQTEGAFIFATPRPGTTFQVLLAPGLVDLAGQPVLAPQPGKPLGSRKSFEFTVSTYFAQGPL